MNGSPFGRMTIYLLNGARCMILSHANQMECSKQALLARYLRVTGEGNGVTFFCVTMTGGAADPEEHLA